MNKEHKKITHIYAALTVSLLMSFLPMMAAAAMALIMFTGVWIAAYALRKKADHDSLTTNHMTFIIRTMWIASFFATITMTAACIYVLSVYDPSSIGACAQTLMNSGAADMTAMELAVKPCMDEFMSTNMTYFINGAVMGAGPVVIYLGYRLSKGLARALKGHRIGNVKSWI